MTIVFRGFTVAAGLLVMAILNCAVVGSLVLQTHSTRSMIFAVLTVSPVILAGIALLGSVVLQRIRNLREVAFRETCVAMYRKPGEPMTPAFHEALGRREEELARAERKTPTEQKVKLAADVLISTLLCLTVNAAASIFLSGTSAEMGRLALAGLHLLPGFLAVALYGSYKLYNVNRIKELRLLQIMIDLRLAELSEEEATRRKDLWVSRYLSRTLLQIAYEPA